MPDPQRCPACGGSGVVKPPEPPSSASMKSAARSVGYTGNPCSNCGGWRMRRNGTCEVCDDCGTTTGCS